MDADRDYLVSPDHNLGAIDYVNVGAKLVVPEQFQYYWENLQGVQFETARYGHHLDLHTLKLTGSPCSEEQPWTYKDSNMQAWVRLLTPELLETLANTFHPTGRLASR